MKTVLRNDVPKTPALKGILLCVFALICIFSDVRLALAHGKHANASKETATAVEAAGSPDALQEFVLHAKAHWEVPVPLEQSLNLWQEVLDEIQRQGDWKSGSKYLILVDKQGRCIAHGYYKSAPGRDLTTLRDSKGTDVVQELIEVAKKNKQGGFVDYYWNDNNNPSYYELLPKSSYAVNYTVRALGIELVLIGGFHHNELFPSMTEVLEEYVPEVKAGTVKDKDTLANFVEKAAEFVNHAYETTKGNMDIAELLTVSSRDEAWKHNEIYLFAITKQGLVVFNGYDPSLKKTPTFNAMNVVDANGLQVGKEMVKVAERGGGFVNYLWDNPLVKGDEINEVGKAKGTSLKIGYVKQVKLGDDTYILGSGFYPDEEHKDVIHMKTESRTLRIVIITCLILLVMFCVSWWKSRSK